MKAHRQKRERSFYIILEFKKSSKDGKLGVLNFFSMVFQGILGMIVGFLILVFRPKIKDFTGDIGFAERYFGAGGTWTFLALLGAVIFIFSLMWALGTLQGFLMSTFGKIL